MNELGMCGEDHRRWSRDGQLPALTWDKSVDLSLSVSNIFPNSAVYLI